MPSPVQSNCDAHDTIANGQYGAVWSMGHTQQVCVRIVLLPSNVWQQFFGRSAFLRQQETDLPPAELWCACPNPCVRNCSNGKCEEEGLCGSNLCLYKGNSSYACACSHGQLAEDGHSCKRMSFNCISNTF
ncbi:low-density lipoprotein receptor-related protein 1 [Trichonephila clavipes]|nr:low-density lipoprotein receptor-related protein 1 [Trichonephila clavipes]